MEVNHKFMVNLVTEQRKKSCSVRYFARKQGKLEVDWTETCASHFFGGSYGPTSLASAL